MHVRLLLPEAHTRKDPSQVLASCQWLKAYLWRMGGSAIANRHPSGLTSTAVADAMQELGLDGALTGVTQYSGSVVVGTAFTVRLCSPEQSERPFNSYLDELTAGSVVVVDNDGRRGFSVFGGLMCADARRRGVLAAVVRGDVRDVAEARDLRFGLFALGRTPLSGRPLVRLEATNVPIDWDGTKIEPGDTIVADGDGVVVVPAADAKAVMELAAQIEASDAELLRRVNSGVPLGVARAALKRETGLERG
jgi:regulator of RNase E activity RraA